MIDLASGKFPFVLFINPLPCIFNDRYQARRDLSALKANIVFLKSALEASLGAKSGSVKIVGNVFGQFA